MSFGKSSRFKQPKDKSLPGLDPGTYHIPTFVELSKKKKFTLRVKHTIKTTPDTTPSPAAYNPQPIRKRLAVSMSTRHLKRSTRHETPGPGSYEVTATNKTMKGAPAFSFRPKTASVESRNDVPGPCAYDLGTTIGQGRQATVLGRWGNRPRTADTTPGVGSYSIASPNTAPYYTMRPKLRDPTLRVESTPGPSAYALKSTISADGTKGKTFGIRRPPQHAYYAANPGPGAYDLPEQRSSKAITIKGARYSPDKNRYMPGAADYAPPSNYPSKKYSFGRKHTHHVVNHSPGPIYDLSGYKSVTSGIGKTMSGRQVLKMTNADPDTPGPSAYDLSSQKSSRLRNAPSYTMRVKANAQYTKTSNTTLFFNA